MTAARVGVIGGSGFYQMEGLADIEHVEMVTPFGDPSAPLMIGSLSGERVAFLPRHGPSHRIMPSDLPVRANIWALKKLGVEFVLSISAVGSLRRRVKPLHLVIPDQVIDRTSGRPSTFFGRGIVAHVSMADPFCPSLRQALTAAAEGTEARVHHSGTLVVIEGPAFSTRAESELYRTWGADIIGMTALPEAKLAREAELCYATLNSVTDYDVWHEAEEDVSVDLVVANLQRNVAVSKEIVRALVGKLPPATGCGCRDALRSAFITPLDVVPPDRRRDLAPIIGRYLPGGANA